MKPEQVALGQDEECAVDTRVLFATLGFREDWEAITDQPPAYIYDFGNLVLHAAEVMGRRYLKPVFLMGGVTRDARSIGLIDFEMPLTIDSLEQGVALIAHAVGRDFQPLVPTPWLSDGRKWQDHLPWSRDRARYEARPSCSVPRDWFRVARDRLQVFSEESLEADLAWLTFDGEVLRFTIGDAAVTVPAAGRPWSDRYAIRAIELKLLPKRLTDPVWIDIWDATLGVGNRRWQLRG